jgi:hypothetical protein
MKDFYQAQDHPSTVERNAIWQGIERELPNSKHTGTSGVIIHWRSFLVGNAAAILLLLATYGAFALFAGSQARVATPSTPASMYAASIEDLVNLVPDIMQQASVEERQALESKLQGVREIDRIIEELQRDILLNGATENKRRQLKRMYAMKIELLKDVLLTGEFAS